jgi:hypothetical protein
VEFFSYAKSMKKKRGRPPKKAKDRKDVDLRIPVTAEQKASILEACAADGGAEMASWARGILLRATSEILARKGAEEK